VAQSWRVFDSDMPVLTCAYSFGPTVSNALAIGIEGGLVVVSPPYRARMDVFEALRDYGPVRALVASNSFHHMGIPEWKARFPEAAVFAPAQSVARVRKKTCLSDVKPLSEARAITGERLELVDMPHYRTGETLVRIHSGRGLAWYVTDIILNIRELPSNLLLKLLFKMTGSAPGLRFNKVGPKLMVKDMRALKAWLKAEYERTRPRWLIATHGEIADLEAEREAARRLFSDDRTSAPTPRRTL
jgi:hypothetical protein